MLDKVKLLCLFSCLLQNDPAHHGRDETAPNRELLDAFKCLWTYFQLNEGAGTQRDPAIPSFDRIYQPSR